MAVRFSQLWTRHALSHFLTRSSIPLALLCSFLVIGLLHFVPELFPGQFVILSIFLHSAVLLINPAAPQVRALAYYFFLRFENDRPLTPEENFVYVRQGIPLYAYTTTSLACNSPKIAISFIKITVLLVLIKILPPFLLAFGRVAIPLAFHRIRETHVAKNTKSVRESSLLYSWTFSIYQWAIFVIRFISKTFNYLFEWLLKSGRSISDRCNYSSILGPKDSYMYGPFRQPRQVRLLRIKRRKPFAQVECELIPVNIDQAPPYEAMSYTWDSPELTHGVTINGKLLKTTEKVHSIINERSSLRKSRLLWIDFICIDQNNIKEKGTQVLLMGDIYRKASRVIIWLGHGVDSEDIPDAMSGIRTAIKFGSTGWYGDIRAPWLALMQHASRRRMPALVRFLTERYWLRVWIIQEIALQRTVHILYGKTWLFWEDVTLILKGFGTINPKSALRDIPGTGNIRTDGETSQISMIARLKDWLAANRQIPLARIIHLCVRSKATNPKDKIYGLLGMSSRILENPIVLDYDDATQVDRVYLETAQNVIRIQGPDQLFLLQQAGIGYGRRLKGLPTWVPDWSRPPRPYPLARGFIGDEGADRYRASDDRLSGPNPILKNNLIRVTGFRVDRVKVILHAVVSIKLDTNRRSGAARAVRWIAAARNLVSMDSQATRRYGPHLNGSFWRTLIGDRWRTMRPVPIEMIQFCKLWLDRILKTSRLERQYQNFDFGTLILSDPMNWSAAIPRFSHQPRGGLDEAIFSQSFSYFFENLLHEASFGRRFAITETGYMTLLPPGAANSDVIYVICGAETPFALRREDGADTYRLVGEAYVHGIMNGERAKQGDIPEELLIC